ncbi:MAG: SGNH/GDSL hydrolase family protein [Snowella sp.]|nr:SGNH/GDSL hydrolase family protein [Snowella sp.]
MAKLVAIGDSLTQGFQSGAILKTEWSYPAMIARSIGLSVPTDFRIPSFHGSGLPVNIEELLRFMEITLGDEISRNEWILRFPFLLEKFIDEVEDLYERGRGRKPSAFKGQFHNLAVWGFRVLDAFTINSDYCDQVIKKSEGRIEDDFLGLPSAPMHRTACMVLNPAKQKDKKKWTQIDNLKVINDAEGVENLIIWLGANDCLGTVVGLKLKEMPASFSSDDPEERRKFNLTHPDVFRKDYATLLAKVKAAISTETRVFVGTIPYVTIPPITQGIGELSDDSQYFNYYGRFFANNKNFHPFFNSKLTGEEIRKIDKTIDKFNEVIRSEVSSAGGNFHLVEMGDILNSLAVKRNHLSNVPSESLREYYKSFGIDEHPLLKLDPVPSVLLFKTQNSTRIGGGLFSLDSIHPSTIGYGIVAEAFLKKMKEVGVKGADPSHLDWGQIIAQDSLLQSPPTLWDDIVNGAERNSIFWDVIFKVLG